MKLSMPKHTLYPQLVWLLAVTLLSLGIFFRFYGLDKSIIWHDEALTLLHFSGYSAEEAAKRRLANSIIDFAQVRKDYQSINIDRGPEGVLQAVATDQPVRGPLFYLVDYFWVRQFNSEPATARVIPALFGTLQLPATYWLAWELFQTRQAAVLATVFMALSPLQLFYGQELREYSLFALIILLSSAQLLKAHRTEQLKDWLFYSILLCTGFHTSYLMSVVTIAHFVYATYKEKTRFSRENPRLSRLYLYYLGASILAVICFSPWIAFLAPHIALGVKMSSTWLAQKIPLGQLINAWAYGPSSMFFMRFTNSELTNSILASILMIQLVSVLVTYSYSKKRVFPFLACLYVVSACSLYLPDLIVGGQRSLHIKYIMAIPIAALMFVTYACYVYISSDRSLLKWLSVAVAFFIIGCEIGSCEAVLAITERFKVQNQSLEAVSKVLNSDQTSLVVCEENSKDTNFGQMLALSYLVKPGTKLLWLDEPMIPAIPEGIDHFYLFDPPPALAAALRDAGYRISPIDRLDYLSVVRFPVSSESDIQAEP